MRDLLELREFFERVEDKDSLVLCTLVRKHGSGFRKSGAKKLVAVDGQTCGLLSGGCLEGEIEKMARERRAEMPFVHSFQTTSEEDRLFGYQTGCPGVLDILFETVGKRQMDLLIPFGMIKPASGVSISLAKETLGRREFSERLTNDDDRFFDPWIEPVQFVVIGCGVDAPAYAPLVTSLGWNLRFLDHRKIPVDRLADGISEGPSVAVIVMTHNYEADLAILRGLMEKKLGYVGFLGPALRFEQMKKDLLHWHKLRLSSQFESICCAPAGIFHRSSSPQEIALSVVAQVQEKIVEKKAASSWTLILAAGKSSRFGGVKALAKWRNQTLLARAIQTAKKFSGENVMVVTGCHAELLASELNSTQVIHNSNWMDGMGSSIATGTQAIRRRSPVLGCLLILPVDQPLVTEEHLRELEKVALASRRCALTVDDKGIHGAPAAIPSQYLNKAEQLTEDRGLKSLLNPEDFIFVKCPRALHDVDEPQDLARLLEGSDASL